MGDRPELEPLIAVIHMLETVVDNDLSGTGRQADFTFSLNADPLAVGATDDGGLSRTSMEKLSLAWNDMIVCAPDGMGSA